MKRRAALLLVALALPAAGGCDLLKSNWSSLCTISIDRDRAAVGQVIDVTFEKLADEDGRRFWVAVQREDASNLDQEGRIPVPPGAHTMRLTLKKPGAHEVRVYTEDNGAPNTIVARKKIRITE